MALTPNERDVITFIEQYYLINGKMPEISEIAASTMLPQRQIAVMLGDANFQLSMKERGISRLGATPGERLSEEQLAVANLMLDFTDGRSDKKKLDSLGVSSAKYQAWKRDPVFRNYMQSRAESMLGDNIDTAHVALLDSVRSGDTQALKLYYEMTGRYNSRTVDNMNMQLFMARMLEILQRHLTPEQMREVGHEFSVLAELTQPKELIHANVDRAS